MRRAVRAIVVRDDAILVIKRNKFGKQYYILPGGGVEMGEDTDQALRREMQEETGLELGDSQLVFIEQSGEPYGTQYVYRVEYRGGEPKLNPLSDEANINTLGQNLYAPMWLPISQLPSVPLVSERLKQAVLDAIQHGFPSEPVEVV